MTTNDVDFDRLAGRLLFTLGCTPGLNLPDTSLGVRDDWVQRLAGKAVYVANTGYGYADGKVVGLTERLLALYAGRVGGQQTAGQALMYAKQAYLGGLGLYTNYDEKVMMEATYYGLPMYRFADPVADLPPTSPTTSTDPITALTSASFNVDPTFTTESAERRELHGRRRSGPAGRADRPVLPRTSVYATVAGQDAHDALITSLETTREPAPPPRPTGRQRRRRPGAHRVRVGLFPVLVHQRDDVRHSGRPAAGRRPPSRALVRADTDPATGPTTGTTELFDHTGLQVFYSDEQRPDPADDHPPTATRSGGNATFTMRVEDNSTVKRVVVLQQTTTGGPWTLRELTQSGATWSGTFNVGSTGTLRWIAQAVDGAGNVALTTNRGELQTVSATAPTIPAQAGASSGSGSASPGPSPSPIPTRSGGPPGSTPATAPSHSRCAAARCSSTSTRSAWA